MIELFRLQHPADQDVEIERQVADRRRQIVGSIDWSATGAPNRSNLVVHQTRRSRVQGLLGLVNEVGNNGRTAPGGGGEDVEVVADNLNSDRRAGSAVEEDNQIHVAKRRVGWNDPVDLGSRRR